MFPMMTATPCGFAYSARAAERAATTVRARKIMRCRAGARLVFATMLSSSPGPGAASSGMPMYMEGPDFILGDLPAARKERALLAGRPGTCRQRQSSPFLAHEARVGTAGFLGGQVSSRTSKRAKSSGEFSRAGTPRSQEVRGTNGRADRTCEIRVAGRLPLAPYRPPDSRYPPEATAYDDLDEGTRAFREGRDAVFEGR